MATDRGDRHERRTSRQRRTRLIGWGALAAVVVIVAGVLALSGGDDDSGPLRSASTTTSGATTTTVADPTGTTGPPGGPCKASDVSAALGSSGVKGTDVVTVVAVTNTKNRSCTVSGYPGLQLLGPQDEQVPTEVLRGGGSVPATLTEQAVTIEAGKQASFVMSWAAGGSCLDVRAFDMTLPGDSKAVNAKASVTVCDGGKVHVSPFQPDVVSA